MPQHNFTPSEASTSVCPRGWYHFWPRKPLPEANQKAMGQWSVAAQASILILVGLLETFRQFLLPFSEPFAGLQSINQAGLWPDSAPQGVHLSLCNQTCAISGIQTHWKRWLAKEWKPLKPSLLRILEPRCSEQKPTALKVSSPAVALHFHFGMPRSGSLEWKTKPTTQMAALQTDNLLHLPPLVQKHYFHWSLLVPSIPSPNHSESSSCASVRQHHQGVATANHAPGRRSQDMGSAVLSLQIAWQCIGEIPVPKDRQGPIHASQDQILLC